MNGCERERNEREKRVNHPSAVRAASARSATESVPSCSELTISTRIDEEDRAAMRVVVVVVPALAGNALRPDVVRLLDRNDLLPGSRETSDAATETLQIRPQGRTGCRAVDRP